MKVFLRAAALWAVVSVPMSVLAKPPAAPPPPPAPSCPAGSSVVSLPGGPICMETSARSCASADKPEDVPYYAYATLACLEQGMRLCTEAERTAVCLVPQLASPAISPSGSDELLGDRNLVPANFAYDASLGNVVSVRGSQMWQVYLRFGAYDPGCSARRWSFTNENEPGWVSCSFRCCR